ncbi:MAG: hypothetical protein ACRDJY_12365, partial [Thermoleophilaceae bacterium]
YGIIINDTTGGGNFAFEAQDPGNGVPDPYLTGAGVGGIPNGNQGYLAGTPYYEVFDEFPWDRLRMIRANQCPADPEVGPCPPS